MDKLKDFSPHGISVIICCFNSEAVFPRCLESVNQQIFKQEIPWEVIIVDNRSEDGTSDIATEFFRESHIPYQLVSEKKGFCRKYSTKTKSI